VLYLRLMALRSMAPEIDDQKLSAEVERSKQVEEEMFGLLEEADQAAKSAEEEEGEHRPSAAARTDSPDLAFLVKKLKNSLKKEEEWEAANTQYSPTQSPIVSRLSTPVEPRHLLSSPTPSPPPSPPYEPQQPALTPKPPPPPQLSETVIRKNAQARSCNDDEGEEPLPPGDADFVRQLAKPKPGQTEPVDMELGSADEAEVEFFRHQREDVDQLFPASVWAFGGHTVPQPGPSDRGKHVERISDVLKFSNDRERYEAFMEAVVSSNRKKKLSEADQRGEGQPATKKKKRRRKSVSASRTLVQVMCDAKVPEPAAKEEEEDVEALRAQLLSSMMRKRNEKKSTKDVEGAHRRQVGPEKTSQPASEMTAANRSSSASSPDNITRQSLQRHPLHPPASKPLLKTVTSEEKLLEEINQNQAAVKVFEASLRLDQAHKNLHVKRLEKSKHLQFKHFPNLFKKVSVPLGAGDSGDEENQQEGATAAFSSSLQLLLREGRAKANGKKRTPPPKPVRRHPPAAAAKAPSTGSVTARSILTASTKEKIVSEALPYLKLMKPAKQKEYCRLLARLQKLQETKRQGKPAAPTSKSDALAVPSSSSSPSYLAVKVPLAPEDDDDEAMRSKLLKQMAEAKSTKLGRATSATASLNHKSTVNTSREDGSPSVGKCKSPTIVDKDANLKVTVKHSDEDRQVANAKVKVRANVKHVAVLAKERDVISKRKALQSDLFKLSAQMSALKEASRQQRAARALVDNLRQQLFEAESLLANKEKRVADIRLEVMTSRSEALRNRGALDALEGECERAGRGAEGENYSLPDNCANAIKDKLSVIAKSAQDLLDLGKKSDADQQQAAGVNGGNGLRSAALGAVESRPAYFAHLPVDIDGQSGDSPPKLDPHLELCRFELRGRCNDSSCTYQHLDKR